MQFLPASASEISSAAAEMLQRTLQSNPPAAGFTDLFENLAEFDENNMPGLPDGFRKLAEEKDKLAKEDLEALEEELRRRGLDRASLEVLGGLSGLSSMPSVGQIANAMRGAGRISAGLSEQEGLNFRAALQKLGFGDDDIAEINDLADQGKGAKILQVLGKRLDGGDTATLNKDECAALLRSMDLSEKTSQKVMGFFQSGDELTVDKAGLQALLNKANKELAAREKSTRLLADASTDAVAAMLQQGRIRKKSDAAADKRIDARSGRSEALMKDSATAEGQGAQKRSAEAVVLERSAAQASANAEQNAADSEAAFDGNKRRGRQGFLATSQDLLEEKTGAVSEKNKPSRVEKTETPLFIPLEKSAYQQASNAQAQQAAAPRADQAKIFAQVEQAVLQNATQGSKQLVLRMDPPDLGQLTLSVSVNGNGELKAVIRTENTETASLLSEQLDKLRASLEEQGFKVNELEVRSQLSGDSQSQTAWNGESEHNLRQSLEDQARLSRLARMRQDSGDTLARNMQSSPATERFSHEGMHLIA